MSWKLVDESEIREHGVHMSPEGRVVASSTTERLLVPGGHLYKVTENRWDQQTTMALCFVPYHPAEGALLVVDDAIDAVAGLLERKV